VKTLLAGIFGTLLLASTSLSAAAADLPSHKAAALPPLAPVETWYGPSHWLFRLRALGVVTDSKVSVDGTPLSARTTNSVVPELDVTYFFNKNFAAELVLGATPHWVKLAQPASLSGFNLGNTVLLPPTLTFQYHFTDLGPIKPYIGVGVNYTWFLGTTGQGLDALSIRSNVAPAFQVGADYFINEHWGINVDVKKLLLRTSYTGNATTALGVPYIHGSARIDPWLIGAGVSYRF